MTRRDLRSTIGQQIKEARKRCGFTQRDLAERVGVQYQAIQNYERGERMSLARLLLIAKVLDVDFKISRKDLIGAVAAVVGVGVFFAALCCVVPRKARAGERIECSAEPLGKDWHYRTKVPGFSGDVRGDRCWYDGPSMKPRDELYWPDKEQPVEMVPLPAARPRADVEFQDRWEGLWARE